MQQDFRDTGIYKEVEALYCATLQPGKGQISDAAGIDVAPNGIGAVFSGTVMESLHGGLRTRICHLDLKSGEIRTLTSGSNTDRSPKHSPDGTQIAFLSDRREAGSFELYLLDTASETVRPTPKINGWVEYLHWSPNGRKILLGVAGFGADVGVADGAVTSRKDAETTPSWMPAVEAGDESYHWRSVWIYDLTNNTVRQVSKQGSNIWEAVWCGEHALAAVCSNQPGEAHWYTASLRHIDLKTSQECELYIPTDQLGWLAVSPSGQQLSIVEARCSDRGIVAGDLLLVDVSTSTVTKVDTAGIDITHTEWRTGNLLLLAGHRGFEVVIGLYDTSSKMFGETWVSDTLTGAGRYISVSGLKGECGPCDCLFVAEGFLQAPEVAQLKNGQYKTVKSFDQGYADQVKTICSASQQTWQAPDGLEIQGWLLQPACDGPHPLILQVHGGPVWHWRPYWLGRSALALSLLKRGSAIFMTNPRGSSGRGQTYARRVYGDVGGGEIQDQLSGIDYLVDQGIADPARLGVTGVSHGGYISAWLITQDSRFAAAVPVAPVTDWVNQHLVSNIQHFDVAILQGRYDEPNSHYFERSPIMHAHKVNTPTLNLCGALDACIPPGQALEFHNALLRNKVPAVLVTYPEEGHGIRKFPALIDYAARVVAWFEKHLNDREV